MKLARQIEILNNMVTILTNKNSGITCVCDALQIQFSNALINPRNPFYITDDENRFMDNLIKNCKPTPTNPYANFIDSEFWLGKLFWWLPIDEAPETRQIRIDFINAIITNIK